MTYWYSSPAQGLETRDDFTYSTGMNDEGRLIECGSHGTQPPAFVCRHLNLETPVGFIEGYDPDTPDEPLYHAWCSACDAVLQEEGDWNDRSEDFARPHLVCRGCYREMKALNRRSDTP